MSVIHEKVTPAIDARALIFPIVLGIGLLALFVRLWFLQVVQAEALSEKAEATRRTVVEKLAPRGMIVDRKGRVLAGVQSDIVVTAEPRTVLRAPEILRTVAQLLGKDAADIKAQLEDNEWRPYVPTPIATGVPLEIATRLAEAATALPGIAVEGSPIRRYADPALYSHVLGYVATPNERDVTRLREKGVDPAAYVGKLGLEYVYETSLMGVPGKDIIEVDARRRPLRRVQSDNAIPGDRLVLALDADLQRTAYALLEGRKGAIVAIDPRDGGVLCLASSPGYDTSLFLGGISTKDYARLRDDPAKPQIARAIATGYAPGSTFKIVTSLASQLAGQFNPNESINCPGYYAIGNRRMKCMSRHGAISFHRAMTKSCNTFFATLAVRAGPEKMREAAKLLGLGQRTGIDLIGESRGIVPTEEWIQRWRKPPVWYGGDTVNFAIGQGEVSTTPLQMAHLIAMVANRGHGFEPHLVKGTIAPGARAVLLPKALVPNQVPQVPAAFWDRLHEALGSVVREGTARAAAVPGIAVAAKTGSSENRQSRHTHSWLVAFAPIGRPTIAIAVLIENAGHGGEVAAPIAGKILRQALLPPVAKPEPQPGGKGVLASRPADRNLSAEINARPASAPLPTAR